MCMISVSTKYTFKMCFLINEMFWALHTAPLSPWCVTMENGAARVVWPSAADIYRLTIWQDWQAQTGGFLTDKSLERKTHWRTKNQVGLVLGSDPRLRKARHNLGGFLLPTCWSPHNALMTTFLILAWWYSLTASQSAQKLLGTRVGAFVKPILEIESFKCILVTNVVMDTSRTFWIEIRSSSILALDTFMYFYLDFLIFQCMLAFNPSYYVSYSTFSIHIHI